MESDQMTMMIDGVIVPVDPAEGIVCDGCQ